MKQIQCKPLGLPSHTPWKTEDQGTTNESELGNFGVA